MREVPDSQILARLREDNPWWQGPRDLPEPMQPWTPRPYLEVFLPHVMNREVRRAVVLMGPRRVGKTVMIHHAIQRLIRSGKAPERLCYVSIDHPLYNGKSLEQMLDLYSQASGTDYKAEDCWVFFDEIQYLKDWEVHLKALVDRYHHPKFVASGSAAAALKLKSAESGAGRFTEVMIPPLSFYEFLGIRGEMDLVGIDEKQEGWRKFIVTSIDALNVAFLDYVNYGGYPEVVVSDVMQRDPGRYVKADIVDKVLLRDLPSLYGIQDIQELNSLFTTLAYNTAGEVSLEALSRSSGVSKNTLKRYVEYIEAAFLVRTIHRVDRDARRFARARQFKVYLTNPSMRSALFSKVDAKDPAMGALVETALFAQWFHTDQTLYYARWKDGEVDMVYMDAVGSPGWVVEAKWSDGAAERSRSFKSLLEFCVKNDVPTATLTTRTLEGRELRGNVEIEMVPAAKLCFIVGYNLIQHRMKPSFGSLGGSSSL